MIIVTGGAGFIGSNIVKALNERGRNDIIIVDELDDGKKMFNINDLDIFDYQDKDDFITDIQSGAYDDFGIEAIFHLGACSATTEWDGHYIMQNNYEYSKVLLHFCLDNNVQFIYASSASVYGCGLEFAEDGGHELPINMYAYSKSQFDQYLRKISSNFTNLETQVAGFRYFNVYGPREQHKGSMSSTPFHFNNQIKENGVAKLFSSYSDDIKDGEQQRDFVYVDDVVSVNLWFFDNKDVNGIFNVGTGNAQTFNDIGNAVVKWHGTGKIEYIEFPEHLKGSYQVYTQADLTKLRAVGYDKAFNTVEQGVKKYLDWLNV